jgi:RimJ/RimL family protein N-acetyltransferase
MAAILEQANALRFRVLSVCSHDSKVWQPQVPRGVDVVNTGDIRILGLEYEPDIIKAEDVFAGLNVRTERGRYSDAMLPYAVGARQIMADRPRQHRTRDVLNESLDFVRADAEAREEWGEESLFVVLEREGRLAAFVEFRRPDRARQVWVVDQIGVVRRLRGTGLGYRTLRLGLDRLESGGHPIRVFASVDAENQVSERLHRSAGFRISQTLGRWEVRS